MKKIFYIVPKDIIIGAFIVLILAWNAGIIVRSILFGIWIFYIIFSIVKVNRGKKYRYLIKYCPFWKRNYIEIFMNNNWWVQTAERSGLQQFINECSELYESIPKGTIIELCTHKTIVDRIRKMNPQQIFVTGAYVDSISRTSKIVKIKNRQKKQFYHVLIEK